MSLIGKLFIAGATKGDAKRDAGLTTPENIQRFDDILYGPNKKWNVLDVYRPKDAEGKLPVLINIHGGGWIYGDKELYQFYCMEMAQHGFAVVNFSYSLAPEAHFPTSYIETNTVVNWVLNEDNAEQYGFDTTKVFFAGDSAGAHTAAMYACMCINPDFAKKFPFETPEGFVPTAMLLNCGVYDCDYGKNPFGKALSPMLSDFMGHKITKDELKLLSPNKYVNEKFPPSYIMTANADFLQIQPPFLMKKLDEVGVSYVYKKYGDKNEKLGHVFHCDIRKETSKLCNKEEADFLKSFC